MRAIPERLRGAFTTRRYTNPRLPLPLPIPRPPILHSSPLPLRGSLNTNLCSTIIHSGNWQRAATRLRHIMDLYIRASIDGHTDESIPEMSRLILHGTCLCKALFFFATATIKLKCCKRSRALSVINNLIGLTKLVVRRKQLKSD